MAKPWDRQDSETAKSFAAFEVYRGQPSDQRSIRRVAQEVGKSETLIGRWSKRDKWVERVRAFDESIAAEEAERLRQKRIREAEEMRERHRVVGRLALARATKALSEEVDGKAKIPIDSAVDVYRMVKTGMMLEESGHATALAPGRASMSGDNAGTADNDLPRITKLEVEIITDGGKRMGGDEIAAKLRAFYDEPGGDK